MASSKITLSELQAELDALRGSPDDLLTMQEIRESWLVCQATAAQRVRLAINSGLMQGGMRKRITDISGRVIPVPAYRIVKQKRKKT